MYAYELVFLYKIYVSIIILCIVCDRKQSKNSWHFLRIQNIFLSIMLFFFSHKNTVKNYKSNKITLNSLIK